MAIHSTDGESWTLMPTGSALTLNAVAASPTHYVAVGYWPLTTAGGLSHSADGITWKERLYPFDLVDIVWSGSLFVTVGGSGAILTSPDGITWTERESGTQARFFSIVSTGSGFVAVGEGDSAYVSPDGITWTGHPTGANYLYSIAWSGSRYAAVGANNVVVTSDDAVIWTVTQPGIFTGPMHLIVWSGTQFVASEAPGQTYASPDGITWHFAGGSPGTDMIRANSKLVAVASGFAWSAPEASDPVEWRRIATPLSSTLRGVTWSGSQYVAVGDYGSVLNSVDGRTWTSRPAGDAYWKDVTWTGSQFVAVGTAGSGTPYAMTVNSPDGVTWTPHVTPSDYELTGVAWSQSLSTFVAVGAHGTILTSADGANWTPRTSGTDLYLTDVAWSGTRFVAVGYASALSSLDGISWTPITIDFASGDNLLGVTWSGTQFVAVGYNSAGGQQAPIFRSPDGVTWTRAASGTPFFLEDVAWTGNQFVSVGFGVTILTSPDGGTWTPRFWIDDFRSGGTLFAVAGSPTSLIAVGDDAGIARSP